MKLLAAVFAVAAAKLPLLTAEIYSTHLAKRHIFVVACPAANQICDKHQDDFEDEWKRFDKQNREEFTSLVFGLTRTAQNAAFFDALTAAAAKPVIAYVEQDRADQKQLLDPAVISQRGLREWLRDIEVIYADKKINQRIEELDIMINSLQDPSYLATLAQSHQKEGGPTPASAGEAGTAGAVAGASEARLQSQIDDAESLSQRERNINIHQVQVRDLDAGEQALVKDYLEHKEGGTAAATGGVAPAPPEAEAKKLSVEDIDITKLSPQEADIIVKYINDRRRLEESRRKKQEEALAATTAYISNPPPPAPAPSAPLPLLTDVPKVINITSKPPARRWSALKALPFRVWANDLSTPPIYPGLWVLAGLLLILGSARYILRFRQNVYQRLKVKAATFEEI